MDTNNPNRFRQQFTGSDRMRQKNSGDQHIDSPDESAEAPHRPHRMSREDVQKMGMPKPDQGGKEE